MKDRRWTSCTSGWRCNSLCCITLWEYRERILPRALLVLVWRTKRDCSCHVFVIVTPSSSLDISEDESLFLALSADESVSYVAKNGRCDKRECGVWAGVLVVMEISMISHSLSQEEEKVTNTLNAWVTVHRWWMPVPERLKRVNSFLWFCLLLLKCTFFVSFFKS